MILRHTRLSGVTVLATGVATIAILCLLLYAHATAQIGFLQAVAVSLLVSAPIAWIGCRQRIRRSSIRRQFYNEASG